jgi:hypothetical protein
MTGFDETVPPDLDPDTDATAAKEVDDNVLPADGDDGPQSSEATGASSRNASTDGTT